MARLTADELADLQEAQWQHMQAWPSLCVSRSGVMRQEHDLDRDGTCVFCDCRPEDWK